MKTALIGYGYWGKILLPKLQALSDVKVVSAREGGYENHLSDVDWVFISTPNDTHFEIVKNCLNVGVNVFCEKPLAPTVAECEELYDIAEANRVKLYVDDVFNYRVEKVDLEEILHGNNFIEVKWDNPNNVDYKNLMYHDLYLLYPKLSGYLTIDWPYINEIKFQYNVSDVKNHMVAGVDFTHTEGSNDALYDMIFCVLNDRVDYIYNRKISTNCVYILERLALNETV
jgi:hypothetical protein